MCDKFTHEMKPTPLNPNELEALRILWEVGGLKPAAIQARFSWPIENATLRSVLVNLVAKGHIRRKLQGKAFCYEARVEKRSLLRATLQTVQRIFTGGSSRELVAHLVETGDIRPADLELILQTAHDNAAPKSNRRSS